MTIRVSLTVILCIIFCWVASANHGLSVLQSPEGTGSCASDKSKIGVTGFSVYKSKAKDYESFKQDLRTIIPTSLSEAGVLEFKLYENTNEPGTFGIFQKWQTEQARKAHLESEKVTKYFNHQYFKELRVSADDFGPWTEVPEPKENENIDMTFYWVMDCPAKYVWDTITNWKNASWAEGQPRVELDETGLIQRRIWGHGRADVFVKIIEKHESNFTVTQETLGGWTDMGFDTFNVTMTMSSEGVDADTQTYFRYNARASTSRGAFLGRQMLKDNFYYGGRIAWYKKFFNCSEGVKQKQLELTQVKNLHKTLSGSFLSVSDLQKTISPFFADDKKNEGSNQYSSALYSGIPKNESFSVHVNPIAVFTLHDLRVISIEDVLTSSSESVHVNSRVVIFQFSEGKISAVRVFPETSDKSYSIASVSHKFYDNFQLRDASKLKSQFSPTGVAVSAGVTTTDIAGYFNEFFAKHSAFKTRRNFVAANQLAQVVEFKKGNTISHDVHVLTFNEKLEITQFESFSKQ